MALNSTLADAEQEFPVRADIIAAATRIFMLFTRTLAERLRQANKRN